MGKRSAFPAAAFRRAIVHARVSPTMSLRQPEPWRHTAQLTISAAVLAWNAQPCDLPCLYREAEQLTERRRGCDAPLLHREKVSLTRIEKLSTQRSSFPSLRIIMSKQDYYGGGGQAQYYPPQGASSS